jgi:hypothetical protein
VRSLFQISKHNGIAGGESTQRIFLCLNAGKGHARILSHEKLPLCRRENVEATAIHAPQKKHALFYNRTLFSKYVVYCIQEVKKHRITGWVDINER